jgi:hypothetical protein
VPAFDGVAVIGGLWSYASNAVPISPKPLDFQFCVPSHRFIAHMSSSDPRMSAALQVGGLGLTLTAADRVVIVDPSWNPSVDNQAVSWGKQGCSGRERLAHEALSALCCFCSCGSSCTSTYTCSRRQVASQ